MQDNRSHLIVLYDGVCGLCNRLIQFLLKHDKHDHLRFASLQSDFGQTILERHHLNPQDLDTLYVVTNYKLPTEEVRERSEAVLFALSQLGGVWKMSSVVRMLPRFMRDNLYDLVARNRYRIFGKYETCLLPDESYKRKFLDVANVGRASIQS